MVTAQIHRPLTLPEVHGGGCADVLNALIVWLTAEGLGPNGASCTDDSHPVIRHRDYESKH
jgi:hypothetical protein